MPWQAITHFQMAISNCAMVHQLQQQPELAAGLQQQVASQQLQGALHGGLQVGMPVQRPLPGPGQVSFARCHSLTCTSQGLSLSSHQLTPRKLQAADPACLQQLQSNCEHTSIVLHAPYRAHLCRRAWPSRRRQRWLLSSRGRAWAHWCSNRAACRA